MSLHPYGYSAVRPSVLHIIKSRKQWDGGRTSAVYACSNGASSIKTVSTIAEGQELGLTRCPTCWIRAGKTLHPAYDWQAEALREMGEAL